MIYLIEKLWTDAMENTVGNAVGYSPCGYTKDKTLAESIVNKGRILTQKDCWALFDPLPEYRFKPIERMYDHDSLR